LQLKLPMHTQQDIWEMFQRTFYEQPLMVRSCGRINIIGEHTDYNDGFVLPASINRHLFFAIAENGTNECHFHAADVGQEHHFKITEIERCDKAWANYLMGVLQQLQEEEIPLEGLDVVFGGDLPIGAGMSSSAALESGFALGVCTLFNLQKSRQELAQLAQRSSHQFVGVPCGIMDQFASLLGRRGQAIKLDCRSLHYEYIPLQLVDYDWVLIDSGVSHDLADSAYAKRVKECQQGVRTLQSFFTEVESLRDVSLEQLERSKAAMPEQVYHRCRYVLEENERLHQAVDALNQSDMPTLGSLMLQTHSGLRDSYEVSCREIDYLVELAESHPGVAGARLMGGGFGGCTLNLVQKQAKADFLKHAKRQYYRAFSADAKHYELEVVDGTDVVS
jgi:galactokinase